MGSFNLMNIGTSALAASQAALTTTGHNIANVNTVGYSRQSTVQATRTPELSGGGFFGRGVDIDTVQRTRSEFLATNASLTESMGAADAVRAEKLSQLEQLFPVGATGLGAAVSNVFSAFTDLASMPADVTARTALLARINDLTTRFNATSTQMDDLQTQVNAQMASNVKQINSLSGQIASLNVQISNLRGAGNVPNDLLDKRDQLVNTLNTYVQTSTVTASDGSLGIFIAGGQPLVLGNTASALKLINDASDSSLKSLVISQSGLDLGLEYQSLGGGELTGLLRFQSQDLQDARNLVGRMALGVANVLNNQHQLGRDSSGVLGGVLFNIPAMKATPSPYNTSNAVVTATVSDPTGNGLQPSDYEIAFTGAGTGTITRLADGTVTGFGAPLAALPRTVDGLQFTLSATAAAGDKFTLKPAAKAAELTSAITSPQKLAATPLSFAFGTQNTGSLQVSALASPGGTQSQTNPYLTSPVRLTFHVTAAGPPATYSYDIAGDGTGNLTNQAYTLGAAISFNGWTLTPNAGAPAEGDVLTIQSFQAAAETRTPVLDGISLQDAYATALATIGTRVQGGKSAAALSTAIAADAKTAATSVSGVNLDEEAAKLLQYQQSYQASAKILQIAQSVFDTLMQSTGR
jgi:flagellar hook-associated protein 1 FlgK